MKTAPLPDFLADLSFTLDGKPLQMFALKDGRWRIGIEHDGDYDNTGVIINLENESAQRKTGWDISYYSSGSSITHTQWDDDESPATAYEGYTFQGWVRSKVVSDIERMLDWHLEALESDHGTHKKKLEAYQRFCEDCSRLTTVHLPGKETIGYRFLGAVHRLRISELLKSDTKLFSQFREEMTNSWSNQRKKKLRELFGIGLHLIPTLTQGFKAFIKSEIEAQYVGFNMTDMPDNRMNQFVQYKARHIATLSPFERQLHLQQLLPHLQTATLCHTVAAEFSHLPKDADLYIQKGLKLDPNNFSLLVFAETFYLQNENPKMLTFVQKRMQRLNIPCGQSANVQDWIDRYTMLCNDYQYFSPKTDTSTTADELIELEAKLNHYWMSMLPSEDNIGRSQTIDELCNQNRFLSAGSASYVGWMRNQHRYQEVVDYMMPLIQQGELSRIRHQSNEWGFETFIGNGLSSFLDSKDEAHISQAIQIIDALEQHIPTWHTRSALYACACVASRANQVDRALVYINEYRSEHDGKVIFQMDEDSDFQNVHEHPEFLAIFEDELEKL